MCTEKGVNPQYSKTKAVPQIPLLNKIERFVTYCPIYKEKCHMILIIKSDLFKFVAKEYNRK